MEPRKLNASGLACIDLTPKIKGAMRDLPQGLVIDVYNDDPASREGVPAWCRLTGNTLVSVTHLNERETIFSIQKK
jgi:TusA-related sulfurtransferase